MFRLIYNTILFYKNKDDETPAKPPAKQTAIELKVASKEESPNNNEVVDGCDDAGDKTEVAINVEQEKSSDLLTEVV